MTLRYLAGAMLVAGLPLPQTAVAADAVQGTENGPRLKPIVITATRIPQHQDETLAATTVVTHKEIERMQASSVQDVLRRTPGISIANQGGAGKLTSIFMRGTASTHVLVLINGVRYTDVTSGLPLIADLPVSNIKRIEIVRGPRSSLYGSDAIGGVIQIFTRNGENVSGTKAYANAGGGSNAAYRAEAGLYGSNNGFNYSLNVGGRNTNGIDATVSGDPDQDGYWRWFASLRGGYQFDNGWKLGAHLMHTKSKVEFDGLADVAKHKHGLYGLSVEGDLTDFWHVKLTAGHTHYEAIRHQSSGVFVSKVDSRIENIGLQNNFYINPHNRLTLGLDYRYESAEFQSKFSKYDKSRDNKGLYVQYLGNWGPHELHLSLRGDDNEQFGTHVTGAAAYGYHINDVYTLSVSYGTAFKAPKFDFLYFPGFANPDLEPETSETYEVGFEAHRDWLYWSLHAYQTQIDDLIVSNTATNFVPYNIAKARIRGIEAAIGFHLGHWRITANASWLDAENRSSGAVHGRDLIRRPDYMADLAIDRSFLDRYSAGVTLHWEGPRYDLKGFPSKRVKLDGFVLVGVRGSVDLTDNLKIKAHINNLFDTEYHTFYNYNQPGRTFFVGLSYHPSFQ